MISGQDLLKQVQAYNPDVDADFLLRACDYAKEMHGDQKRASGEPYYTHPLEVACVLAEMHLDLATIVTAVLHDTLEDTKATFGDLEREFSKEIATLVNGVSKLTRIESQTAQGKQAENFRKLVLAMSEDIRVLLVKLADRIHNMRTLHHIGKPEKRQRIARETIEIYAPLAERIGLHRIKEELEDLSFGHLNPEAREGITKRLSFLRQEGSAIVKNIIKSLEQVLKKRAYRRLYRDGKRPVIRSGGKCSVKMSLSSSFPILWLSVSWWKRPSNVIMRLALSTASFRPYRDGLRIIFQPRNRTVTVRSIQP